MGPNCTEATSLNMAIGHCIHREMFFQCPGLSATDNCKALVTFGKACPIFPFHDGCGKHGKHGKDGKDGKDGEDGNSPKVGRDGKGDKGQSKKQTTVKNAWTVI